MNQPAKSTGSVLLTALGWMALGALIAPLCTLLFSILFYVFDSRCGSPGDSGGCEMGIFVLVIGSIVPGAVFGFVLGLARAIRRRRAPG